MQFGFSAPTFGPLAAPETLARFVAAGEAIGFDYVCCSDHLVIPTDIQARYPYSSTGAFPAGSSVGRHEQLTTLAFIAGRTSRIRLLTAVMVVPYRPALLTAKMLATIDVLSGGRLMVGIGAGWMQEEFEALAAPPFAERGRVTDEFMQAMRELWTAEAPHFEGKHVRFGNISFAPKPVQKPHPPIWVGGESGPALRRIALLGDAWYPIGNNPAHPLDSLARYRAGIARLRAVVAAAGRDPMSVSLCYRVSKLGADAPLKAGDGERNLFSGTAADIAGDLRDFAALGVTHVDFLDFGYGYATADETLTAMARFRDDVLARI